MYNYFSDFTKKIAHLGIEYTFPRTPSIALIAAGTGWYAYQYSITYGPGYLASLVTEQFIKVHGKALGNTVGHLVAPLIVPSLAPYVSAHISLGTSLVTSLTLNLVASLFFGIRANKERIKEIPSLLKNVGTDSNQVKEALKPLQEPLKEEKKELASLEKRNLNLDSLELEEEEIAITKKESLPKKNNMLPSFLEQEHSKDLFGVESKRKGFCRCIC